MKHLIVLSILAALATPAKADETASEGLDMLQEGARLLFEGLLREAEPAMKGLQDLAEGLEPKLREFAENMGPAFGDMLGKIEDFSAYHPPEFLPNGDIIIRKKSEQELEEEIEI